MLLHWTNDSRQVPRETCLKFGVYLLYMRVILLLLPLVASFEPGLVNIGDQLWLRLLILSPAHPALRILSRHLGLSRLVQQSVLSG